MVIQDAMILHFMRRGCHCWAEQADTATPMQAQDYAWSKGQDSLCGSVGFQLKINVIVSETSRVIRNVLFQCYLK